jgi:hypothetical protein
MRSNFFHHQGQRAGQRVGGGDGYSTGRQSTLISKVAPAKDRRDHSAGGAGAGRALGSQDRGHETVLLVEDEDLVRRSLQEILPRKG